MQIDSFQYQFQNNRRDTCIEKGEREGGQSSVCKRQRDREKEIDRKKEKKSIWSGVYDVKQILLDRDYNIEIHAYAKAQVCRI